MQLIITLTVLILISFVIYIRANGDVNKARNLNSKSKSRPFHFYVPRQI